MRKFQKVRCKKRVQILSHKVGQKLILKTATYKINCQINVPVSLGDLDCGSFFGGEISVSLIACLLLGVVIGFGRLMSGLQQPEIVFQWYYLNYYLNIIGII